VAIALGIGLLVLWIAGLAYHAPAALTWLDGAAALVAVGISAAFAVGPSAGMVAAGFLSLGLFVLWIVGLAVGGANWLAWWTFWFACGFLLLAVAAAAHAAPVRRLHRV
jgi:hypothetical protein